MRCALTILMAAAAVACGQTVSQPAFRSRVLTLGELNAPDIAALDRERTVIILPVGMLEQHGPHLPVGADTLGVVYEANRAASRVAQELAGWTVVIAGAAR